MRTVLSMICVLFTACAAAPRHEPSIHAMRRSDALRSQLAGHLERARACLTDTHLRDPRAGGLVHLGFTIRPDGRVADVDVEAWSQDERMLGGCVRSRIVSLYFDPAPPAREVRIERTFAHCPDERDGFCPLGPVRSLASTIDPATLDRVSSTLVGQEAALRECAERAGGGEAVIDVRLELRPDGRIMAGQLRRTHPESTPLARCAVFPLLGASVEGVTIESTAHLRYVYRLSPRESALELGAR